MENGGASAEVSWWPSDLGARWARRKRRWIREVIGRVRRTEGRLWHIVLRRAKRRCASAHQTCEAQKVGTVLKVLSSPNASSGKASIFCLTGQTLNSPPTHSNPTVEHTLRTPLAHCNACTFALFTRLSFGRQLTPFSQKARQSARGERPSAACTAPSAPLPPPPQTPRPA